MRKTGLSSASSRATAEQTLEGFCNLTGSKWSNMITFRPSLKLYNHGEALHSKDPVYAVAFTNLNRRLLTAITSPPGGNAREGEQCRGEASKNRRMIGAYTTLTPRTWVSADENQEQAAARAAGMHRDGSAIAVVTALEPAHYLDTLDTNHCPSLAGTLSLWVTFGSYLPWSNNLFLPSQSLSTRSKPQVQYRKFKNTMELDIPMRQPGAD
ncbi:hypothetical protein MCOR27_006665 [Pyricularia oryzae]|uniref:Uncharacterized protein n=1 Tax=Pyricularia grisea TaxID=148305 RepID=A0ABQ8NB95_PYRGI|nr:hypothetical protein MCOR01_009897 [Pyricularia oryzae]KAI6293883.1 hypothetical protein MCOR33_008841 [Pyricularia grisea]KAH9436799.1 hypothetical protein MCOR02_000464 [Pyricularia oryzae]KAI6276083.1 hypothetical protein MCOR27_006665 [Pyricularia oryzae]KAI6276373.1 hypothetical protein MCOR26_005644 [Pyricularia oryzae]